MLLNHVTDYIEEYFIQAEDFAQSSQFASDPLSYNTVQFDDFMKKVYTIKLFISKNLFDM